MTATIHPIRIQSKQAALISSDKPAIRFIKRQEAEGITGLSCTEICRPLAADNFAKQAMLGPKCVAWVGAEIYSSINDRIDLPTEKRCTNPLPQRHKHNM